MENLLVYIDKLVWSAPIVFALIFTHIYLTFKLKFPQKNIFKGLKLMLSKTNNSGISPFNSLMTVLAATIGTGNIIGISTAILLGGIGSVFWIFLSGIFAISTKYAETYLCLKYRETKKSNGKNKYFGGSMYVLKNRIGSNFLGFIFSFFVITASFGIGCMIQSSSAAKSIVQTFNINEVLVGIIITIISSYVIFGDEKRISKISSIIVPISIFIYLIMTFAVMYFFRNNILNTVIAIIKDAFNIKAEVVGIFSFISIKALSIGLSRGMFSNEAGMGSSPIFACNVDSSDIKNQAIISSTSVFIDTVVLCTLTGIMLASSGMYINQSNPIIFVQSVFEVLPYGKYLLTFSLVSFAIATIPCWGYYGLQGVRYIFKNKSIYQNIYKLIYTFCVYVGCISTLQFVWSLSSIANFFMIIPNLFMVYYLVNEIK